MVSDLHDPNQGCKMWPYLIQTALTARPPQKKKKKKNNPQTSTTRAQLYFWTAKHGAPPSAGSQVSTRRLHNQTPSAVSVPLKIPWVQSPNVFLAWPDSDRRSIMTFSEIDPGSPKRNAFDRCLSLQLHKSRYTKWEVATERAGCCGFKGKALGNIRFYQLSLPHLCYLNISEHEHTQSREPGEHMLLPN